MPFLVTLTLSGVIRPATAKCVLFISSAQFSTNQGELCCVDEGVKHSDFIFVYKNHEFRTIQGK